MFKHSPVQLSITSENWESFLPVSQVQNTEQNITFAIPPSSSEWTDAQLFLEGSYKIVNGDGSALLAEEEIAPCCNAGHSWMSDIDVSINGVAISGLVFY